MNTLLLFFALPVATIILAIVLEKILNCPILVAATFFAIFLIVTFTVFDVSFLVFAIIYTILAFITAGITKVICNIIKKYKDSNDDDDLNDNCREKSYNVENRNNFSCVCSNESFYPTQQYIRRNRRQKYN